MPTGVSWSGEGSSLPDGTADAALEVIFAFQDGLIVDADAYDRGTVG
jgi:hypothetical protein